MLKKYSRFLIVAMIQLATLVIVMIFLVPYLLNTMGENLHFAKLVDKTRFISFLIRLLVYAAIFYGWPRITKKYIKNPSNELLKQINKARFILIGALLSIELLYWVGQL